MSDHFRRVKEQIRGGSSETGWESIPDETQNEFTKRLREGN